MNGVDPSALGTAALWAATFLLALASGLVPFVVNMELYLIGVAVLTDASPLPIVALATTGQMLGKFAVFEVGRGALNVAWIRRRAESSSMAAFARRPGAGLAVMATSSVTGVPPFFAVSFVAGSLGMPLARFLTVGTAGRVIRFSAVLLVPGLFT
jgi:membrane protein YqaA with SNARE-associated domain